MALFKLFRKSPFDPLQEMMKKVVECADQLRPLFEAFSRDDREEVRKLVEKISHLEYEADQIKNRIRSSLPKSIFMPVARADILEILANEDAIADATEDVAVLITLKDIKLLPEFRDCMLSLVERVLEVVHKAQDVINELDVLSETSFEGPEAKRVIAMIEDVCDLEHHTDEFQREVTKNFLLHEDRFTPGELWLWLKIVAKIGDVANYAERMCNRVRLFLSK